MHLSNSGELPAINANRIGVSNQVFEEIPVIAKVFQKRWRKT
jgi:hypothetical protein